MADGELEDLKKLFELVNDKEISPKEFEIRILAHHRNRLRGIGLSEKEITKHIFNASQEAAEISKEK
jgi:hypothetical protein